MAENSYRNEKAMISRYKTKGMGNDSNSAVSKVNKEGRRPEEEIQCSLGRVVLCRLGLCAMTSATLCSLHVFSLK